MFGVWQQARAVKRADRPRERAFLERREERGRARATEREAAVGRVPQIRVVLERLTEPQAVPRRPLEVGLVREIHVQAARADIGVLEILEFRVRRRVHEALDGAAVEPGVHGVRERGIVSGDAPDAHHAVPGQVERVRLARVLVGEEERVAHLQTSVARHRQVRAGRIVHPAEAEVGPHAHHARAVDHDGRAVGVRERHHRIRDRPRATAGVRPGVNEEIRRGGLVVGRVGVPHAERRVGQLAAVLRDGGVEMDVGAVGVAA